MSEFTKGPWTVGSRVAYGWDVYQNDDVLTWVGVVHDGSLLEDNATDNEAEANARLIAAAPDMYEALRELVNSECSFFNSAIESDHLFDFIEWRDRAILAIRKATGESTDAPGA